MKRVPIPAEILVEKLCRPQRIGVFGHRGVGKTTLLTMLYREAAGGRLPGVRLAATDARTAAYLADKVLELEAGEALPATLGEIELRFHLYHEGTRQELVFKDYQGEHVALGRREPIQDFLRDCDALWICLDIPVSAASASCLNAQQEVEQLIERSLAAEQPEAPLRPALLLLTKMDLLADKDATNLPCAGEVARQKFGMIVHALQLHCPQHATLGVSSLGGAMPTTSEDAAPAPFSLQPFGLEEPLHWLAEALQQQDEQRLERLAKLAPRNISLLWRGLHAVAGRYPDAPRAAAFRKRLQILRRGRRAGLLATTVCACLALLLGLWTYDAVGLHRFEKIAESQGNQPKLVVGQWESLQRWHPTLALLHPSQASSEAAIVHQLHLRAQEEERDEQLVLLEHQAESSQSDPQELLLLLQQLDERYPSQRTSPALLPLRKDLEKRVVLQREKQARAAFERMELLEGRGDLPILLDQASRFLQEYTGTSLEPEVRRRRALYLHRLDERAIEQARAYSAAHPLNFYTRREHFQHYLDHHPQGEFANEAAAAVASISKAWDKNDFRAVRDQFQEKPGDVKRLQTLCRSYLAVHPKGRFRPSAEELLQWSERITTPTDYKVILRSGDFDHNIAYWLSRGPSLSVEVEVNGVHHGPSTIITRRYDPTWDYEFPRRIRWKLGDTVRIRVVDHYFWTRNVIEIASGDDDLLAIRLLSGEVSSGRSTITFESDFAMPTLPEIE